VHFVSEVWVSLNWSFNNKLMNDNRLQKELMGIYALWWREFIVFRREKSRIVSSVVQPLMWLFLFGSGVGASINISDIIGITFIRAY
jgi:hypothetical protein